MANDFQIPPDVELRIRREFKTCAYCGRRFRSPVGGIGTCGTKATIEHLNRHGPTYWSEGLREEHLVIVCGRCNSSRGRKRLSEWFASPYCTSRCIGPNTVAQRVRQYVRSAIAKR